jgi:hypothetical protein
MDSQIIEQLGAVRDTGRVNMLDKTGVQGVAYEEEHYALVTFIGEATTGEYVAVLCEMGKARASKRS